MKKLKTIIVVLGLFPILLFADGTWIGNTSVMSGYRNNVSDSSFTDYPLKMYLFFNGSLTQILVKD